MEEFNVRSPDGRTQVVTASSEAEAIRIAKAQYKPKTDTDVKLSTARQNLKASLEPQGFFEKLNRERETRQIEGSRLSQTSPLQSFVDRVTPEYHMKQAERAEQFLTSFDDARASDYAPSNLAKKGLKMIGDAMPESIPMTLPIPTLEVGATEKGWPTVGKPKLAEVDAAKLSKPAKIVGEFSSEMLDPLHLAMAYIAPPVLKGAWKGAGKVTSAVKDSPQYKHFAEWATSKVPETIKENTEAFLRYVTTNYKLPAEYVDSKSQLPYRQVERVRENIGGLKALEKTTPEQAKEMTQIMEGKLAKPGLVESQQSTPFAQDLREKWARTAEAQSGTTPDLTVPYVKPWVSDAGKSAQKVNRPTSLTPQQVEATELAMDRYEQLGKELVELGQLSEKTYLANLRKYVPRAYEKYEKTLKSTDIYGRSAPERIQTQRFKHRKVENPDEPELGRIYGAYPTEKGLGQLSAAVEKAKFFQSVADNPQWASQAPVPGWKQLQNVKGLGKLKDKWVEPNIAYDLESTYKELGKFARLVRAGNTAWKLGKTTYSPAVQVNNAMFNTILADWSGADFATQAKLFPKVLLDVLNKTGVYKDLQKGGVVDITQLSTDTVKHIRSLLHSKKSFSDLLASTVNKPGEVYQIAEQVNKGIIYQAARDKGMTEAAAIAHAKKWGMDYGDVSPLVRDIRQTVVPFITFPSKLAPLATEVMATDPFKVYKYKMLMDAVEEVSVDEGVITRDELDRYKRESKGISVVLPLKGRDGNPLVWKLDRVIPVANVENAVQLGGPAAIGAYAASNIRKFEDRAPMPISPDTDTPEERRRKITNTVLQGLLPGLTPGWYDERSYFKGGASYAKMKRAEKGEIDRFSGHQIDPRQSLLSILGIDLTDEHPSMEEAKRLTRAKKQIEDKKGIIERDAKFKQLTEEEIEWLTLMADADAERRLEPKKSLREELDKKLYRAKMKRRYGEDARK